MRLRPSLPLLFASLAACGPRVVVDEVDPECAWYPTTTDAPSADVPGLPEMLGHLGALAPTPARWWDGAETTLTVALDTAAVPERVALTTWELDTAASGPNASESACAPFRYWTIPLPVVTAGTADGLLTAAADTIEVGCNDNSHNRLPPADGLPDDPCGVRVWFDLRVTVDPSRVPAGDAAPFSARVLADSARDGALLADVWDASGSSLPADTGGPGDTTGTPTSAVLSTVDRALAGRSPGG